MKPINVAPGIKTLLSKEQAEKIYDKFCDDENCLEIEDILSVEGFYQDVLYVLDVSQTQEGKAVFHFRLETNDKREELLKDKDATAEVILDNTRENFVCEAMAKVSLFISHLTESKE